MLYVTDDQAEALALADRIVVMNDARLVDVDSARTSGAPADRFTAAFLGGATCSRAPSGRGIGTWRW